MITNRHDRVARTSTLRCNFSPHNFIRALFRVKKKKPKPFIITCRATSEINWDALKLDLALTDWDQATTAATVEIKSRKFTELFMTAVNSHAPMKRVSIKNATAPPLTAPTLRLLARRREAERNGGETLYRLLNKQCRAAIRKDCRENIARILREGGGDSDLEYHQVSAVGQTQPRAPSAARLCRQPEHLLCIHRLADIGCRQINALCATSSAACNDVLL